MFVLGLASGADGNLTIRKPEKGDRFLISLKTREQLVGSTRRTVNWLLYSAIGLDTVGVILIAVACWAPGPMGLAEDPALASPAAATLPPEAAPSLEDGPVFTPYTVRPDIRNREDVAPALEREYPPLLRDAGIGGTTQLWFLIDEEGAVGRVMVNRSSGHAALDELGHELLGGPSLGGAVGQGFEDDGGTELDMVVNIGKVLSGDWDYVRRDIAAVVEASRAGGAIVKVIFENDYLTSDEDKVRLCEICSEHAVAFVKTSTGYGFVKQPDGSYNYQGATTRWGLAGQFSLTRHFALYGSVMDLGGFELESYPSQAGSHFGAAAHGHVRQQAKRHAQPAHHFGTLRLRHGHADDLGGTRHSQRDRRAFGQRRALVVHRPWVATADVDDQLRDALDVFDGAYRIDSALDELAEHLGEVDGGHAAPSDAPRHLGVARLREQEHQQGRRVERDHSRSASARRSASNSSATREPGCGPMSDSTHSGNDSVARSAASSSSSPAHASVRMARASASMLRPALAARMRRRA